MSVASDSHTYSSPSYRPSAAIRWNGWWFLGAIAPAVVAAVALHLFPLRPEPGIAHLASFALTALMYGWGLLVMLVASRRRGAGTFGADFGWHIEPIDLFLGICALVAVFAVTVATGAFVTSLGPVTTNIHVTGDRFWDVIGLFFFPTLVAAPLEELLFRGLLMRWIRIWMIRRGLDRHSDGEPSQRPLHVSVFVSAAVFASLHLYQVTGTASLVELGIQTFALGVINGYLASRTGRLGGAVVAHGLHNMLAGFLTLAP